MSSIVKLDNALENFHSWSQDVLQYVSRPKYGLHAHHLLQREDPPQFRARPHIDELKEHNTYKYEHHIAPADPTNPSDLLLPPGIIGRLTNNVESGMIIVASSYLTKKALSVSSTSFFSKI